jgi:putative ABC transport system permease protein
VFRSLQREPGLATVIVLTLALGTGALSTTFTLVDAALWRPPPVPDPERVALLYITRQSPTEPLHRERWSYPAITMLKQLASDLGTIANYTAATVTLTGGDNPESISVEIASPSYFSVLQVRPLLGRVFAQSEDDVVGAHPIVLLGYDLWQRRFAGDRAVAGRDVYINGVPLTVVGVMPQGFRGLSDKAQLWLPTTMAPRLTYGDYLTTNQNFISVVARLRAGVDLEQARSALALHGARIHEALPVEDPDSAEIVRATAVPLNEARVDSVTRRSLAILFAAVALLYLLACANATNLLLGRAAARRREAAILASLGAPPTRLLRHFLPEGIALVVLGSAAGLVLVLLASRFLIAPTNVWGPRNFYGSIGAFADPRVDARVLLFASGLTLLTLLLVAWAPALAITRIDILNGLRQGGRGAAARTGSLRQPTLRGWIVGVEAALALLLLVGGGLMFQSFARMRRTDLGIDAERVLSFMLQPAEVHVPPEKAPELITRLLAAITSTPGVVAATVDGGAPVSGSARSTLYIAGRPLPRPEDAPPVLRHYIAPDHFRVLSVPLIRGRVFTTSDDAASPRVAIISETAARTFWPDQDPIGQRVWFGGGSSFDSPETSAEIVGIVGDVVHEPLDVRPNRNDFYTPYGQFTYAWRFYMVRTTGDPLASVPAIRAAVRSVQPDLPLMDVQTLSDRIGSSWSRQRFDAVLFVAFATLALLLSSSGIYAVVSYAVRLRTRELGIRMALGAQPTSLIRMVIREGMGFPAVGLLVGVVGALTLTRFLQAALYEVKPTDPLVFAAAIIILLAVSALACLMPARRAARSDPLQVLRAE